MSDGNENQLLSTRKAGELLAKLQGRAKPYQAATVAKWIREEGLTAELDDNDRYVIEEQELIDWAKGSGMLKDDRESSGSEETPAKKPMKPIVIGELEDSEDQDPDGDQGDDEEEDEDGDLEIAECPECGAEVPITTATVTAVCQSCGEVLQVVEEEDDEESEEEDTEEPKEGGILANPFRLFR